MKVEDELRTRLERAGEVAPLRPIELTDVLQRGRTYRRRRLALAGVGVAACIVAAVVLVAQVVDFDRGRGAPPARERRSQLPTHTSAERAAISLVHRWFEAFAAGDNADAWESLSPLSQANWAGREAFLDPGNGWNNIYGVWAIAANAEYYARTMQIVDREVIVVTVSGELESGPSSASFVVTSEKGELGVSPTEGPGSIEFVNPTFAAEGSGQTEIPVVGPRPEIEVMSYAGVKEAFVLIEGGSGFLFDRATVSTSPPASRIAYVPDDPLDPGLYTATVVVGGPLDAVDTWAVQFEVR
jgi:hypothetical protein